MKRPSSTSPWDPPANPSPGMRYTQNGVDLEFNGRQFVPVFNARNYPNRFERDGVTPKAR